MSKESVVTASRVFWLVIAGRSRMDGAAVHGDFTVGHHHALGLAGGAGGVDQVGLMLRQADKWQLARPDNWLQSGRVASRACGRQLVEHRAEQQTDAAVFDHVVQTIPGIPGPAARRRRLP